MPHFDLIRRVEWPYRQQPDWDAINAAMVEVFDGVHCPSVFVGVESDRNWYVALITSAPVTHQEADRLYDAEDDGT